MWKLERCPPHTGHQYLYHGSEEEEELHVSRQVGAWLRLQGDASISRKHASLKVSHSAQAVKRSICGSVELKELGAKNGTFVKHSNSQNSAESEAREAPVFTEEHRLSSGTEVVLRHGDVVRFGLYDYCYRLVRCELLVATSMLPRSDTVMRDLLLLGGSYSKEWTPNCTLLVMETIKLSAKVACALACGRSVVRPDYLTQLCTAVKQKQQQLPATRDYLPTITEASIQPDPSLFDPNHDRKSVLSGKLFLLSSPKLLKRVQCIVEFAGGKCEVVTARHHSMIEAGDAVILRTPDDANLPSQSPMAAACKLVKRAGLHVVRESDVVLAVLYCSTERFCNPALSQQVLVSTISQSQMQQNTGIIYAPETQAISNSPASVLSSRSNKTTRTTSAIIPETPGSTGPSSTLIKSPFTPAATATIARAITTTASAAATIPTATTTIARAVTTTASAAATIPTATTTITRAVTTIGSAHTTIPSANNLPSVLGKELTKTSENICGIRKESPQRTSARDFNTRKESPQSLNTSMTATLSLHLQSPKRAAANCVIRDDASISKKRMRSDDEQQQVPEAKRVPRTCIPDTQDMESPTQMDADDDLFHDESFEAGRFAPVDTSTQKTFGDALVVAQDAQPRITKPSDANTFKNTRKSSNTNTRNKKTTTVTTVPPTPTPPQAIIITTTPPQSAANPPDISPSRSDISVNIPQEGVGATGSPRNASEKPTMQSIGLATLPSLPAETLAGATDFPEDIINDPPPTLQSQSLNSSWLVASKQVNGNTANSKKRNDDNQLDSDSPSSPDLGSFVHKVAAVTSVNRNKGSNNAGVAGIYPRKIDGSDSSDVEVLEFKMPVIRGRRRRVQQATTTSTTAEAPVAPVVVGGMKRSISMVEQEAQNQHQQQQKQLKQTEAVPPPADTIVKREPVSQGREDVIDATPLSATSAGALNGFISKRNKTPVKQRPPSPPDDTNNNSTTAAITGSADLHAQSSVNQQTFLTDANNAEVSTADESRVANTSLTVIAANESHISNVSSDIKTNDAEPSVMRTTLGNAKSRENSDVKPDIKGKENDRVIACRTLFVKLILSTSSLGEKYKPPPPLADASVNNTTAGGTRNFKRFTKAKYGSSISVLATSDAFLPRIIGGGDLVPHVNLQICNSTSSSNLRDKWFSQHPDVDALLQEQQREEDSEEEDEIQVIAVANRRNSVRNYLGSSRR